jgi:hypothetical protein
MLELWIEISGLDKVNNTLHIIFARKDLDVRKHPSKAQKFRNNNLYLFFMMSRCTITLNL